MKTIEIDGRYYEIPAEWNELTQEQVLQVMDVKMAKGYTLEKAQLKLLKILTGMSWWRFLRAPLVSCRGYRFRCSTLRLSLGVTMYLSRIDRTGLEEYLYLTEFLINTNGLTKNTLPRYRGMYGPADDCHNMIMAEFIFSEHFFMAWAADTGKIDLLDNLVAVLYRPARLLYNKRKNKAGDVRIAFNENLSAYYATKSIAVWPHALKLAIAHFYASCREKWIQDNPDVFEGGDGEPAKYGLISVMRGVAKSGVHGTLDTVEKKYVNAVMMELNELVAEAKEYERQSKSAGL